MNKKGEKGEHKPILYLTFRQKKGGALLFYTLGLNPHDHHSSTWGEAGAWAVSSEARRWLN